MKKKISEMDDSEKRIAIAVASGKWEICSFCGRNFVAPIGFQKSQFWDDFIEGKKVEYLWPTFGEKYQHLVPPNYPADLNATASAEDSLIDESNFDTYEFHLEQVVSEDDGRGAICATASHRVKAFLLTLGHEN